MVDIYGLPRTKELAARSFPSLFHAHPRKAPCLLESLHQIHRAEAKMVVEIAIAEGCEVNLCPGRTEQQDEHRVMHLQRLRCW